MEFKKKDIENFLLNYFIEKEGKSIKKIINKVDLIYEGYIDSLDMITLTFEIQKKFNIRINPNTQNVIKKFKKFSLIVKLIQNKI